MTTIAKPKIRTYSELCKLKTYGDRLEYLSLGGNNHESPRYMSNPFYKSRIWRLVREEVIRRDAGCDMGLIGNYINGPLFVHHMNPLTPKDLEDITDDMVSPEYLITVSEQTHNLIHYGKNLDPLPERRPGDTKLW